MRVRKSVRMLLGIGALAAVAATPVVLPTAGAVASTVASGPGSLVYVKADRVYVANTDASSSHPVTSASPWWAWPSQSSSGVIAVAGGAERVNPGGTTESSGSSEIYAFTQLGKSLLAGPVKTPGSVSGPTDPTYVSHFRISPDGTRAAYDVLGCCGFSGESTFLSPLVAGSSGWRDFQDDYVDPQWVNAADDPNVGVADALALTHNGATVGNAEYAIYDSANQNDGDGSGWGNDTAIPDGWDYQAVFTPDLGMVALFLDDASSYTDGEPRNVELHFERMTFNDGSSDLCTIALSPGAFQDPNAVLNASPSISPDGSTIAWGEDDGIYEMKIADQSDCSAVAGSARRVVTGGSMPSFSTAPLVTAHPVAVITAPKHIHVRHSFHLSAGSSHESGGVIVGYRWHFGDGKSGSGVRPAHKYSRRGIYKVTLVVTDRIGHTSTTTKRLRVRR